MAHISTNSHQGSLFDGVNPFFAAVARIYADWRTYRRTIAELESLTNRELQDLGLSRFAIRQVAYDSVYGK